MKSISKALKRFRADHWLWFAVLSTLLVVLGAAVIFYVRYPYAFNNSNFYAEDGTIFTRNVYQSGLLQAAGTRFNGYLIVGLYGLIGIGIFVNRLFGDGFLTLAKALAVTSYVFLGFVCSLPWLLFRRRLGGLLALLTVLLLTIFPLGGGDYAVIGEIGNLKLAFFFVAVLFMLFRNDRQLCKKPWQFIAVDAVLILCALTNFLSLVVVPFGLLRYKSELLQLWRTKRLPKLLFEHYSLLVIALLGVAYAAITYIKGLPALLNYPLAVGPVHMRAVLPLLYRATAFGLLFPVAVFPNQLVIVALLVFLAVLAWRCRERWTLVFLAAMMLINFLGFLISRPGVTTQFLSSNNAADSLMFFYAGTLLFIFALAYSLRHWFNALRVLQKTAIAGAIVLFCLLAVPRAGDRENSYAFYKPLPTLRTEVVQQCASPRPVMHINVYPVAGQVVVLAHKYVCNFRP